MEALQIARTGLLTSIQPDADFALSFATEVAWDVGEIGLDNYEARLLFGRPDRNVTARFGMMSPLLWDKFGHQRLGIARAHILNHNSPVNGFCMRTPRSS